MKNFTSLWRAALLIACFCASSCADAMYIRPQIDKVAVERLIDNLTKQADANPKDATVQLNLGRVYAMAFALKTDTAEVRKGREDQGAWFGFEPKHVPFT